LGGAFAVGLEEEETDKMDKDRNLTRYHLKEYPFVVVPKQQRKGPGKG